MYEYFFGKIIELNPAYVVIETSGIAYFVNISISTYSKLNNLGECKLYIHQFIREDAHVLYGFFEKKEREIFRHLISVSGVGPSIARMMLSTSSPSEIQQAIVQNDVNYLKKIKGIGEKTAQRIIVDLKDKLGKLGDGSEIFVLQNNTIKDEALSALIMLGFPKSSIEKVIDKVLSTDKDLTVEGLVKKALKNL